MVFRTLRSRTHFFRYETGVGNVIELGDAQLQLTTSEVQRVQAHFNLAAARARLVKALGRPQ